VKERDLAVNGVALKKKRKLSKSCNYILRTRITFFTTKQQQQQQQQPSDIQVFSFPKSIEGHNERHKPERRGGSTRGAAGSSVGLETGCRPM